VSAELGGIAARGSIDVASRSLLIRTVALVQEPRKSWWAMTTASRERAGSSVPAFERERQPDRFVELLECLADLLVETDRQRARIVSLADVTYWRAHAALERLSELERVLKQVGLEAAAVHQLLQHERLI
jgi:hypothetical protein